MHRIAPWGSIVLDPRREALLIEHERTLQLIDKTPDVARYEAPIGGGRIGIVFKHSPKVYYYKPSRVMILRDPVWVGLADGMRVEVRGGIWDSVTEVWTFAGPTGTWSRIFYTRGRAAEEVYRTYPAEQVQLIPNIARTAGVAEVLGYWRDVAYRLAADDPLRRAYDQMGFIHPESVLGRYLGGAPIERRGPTLAPIFPFRCNLSQREAVDNALCRSISVIEGPPGTGKTETILNLVANIVVARDRTVGVVSSNNAAVDNVREKLDESGFGYVIASLGRRERREKFLAEQASRNAQVTRETMGVPGRSPSPQQIAELAGRLRGLQRDERQRAELQGKLDAYRLELRHFDGHLGRQELPDLEGLPLLRRSADRILDYLAESELELEGVRPGLIGRIRKYFRYGSMRGLNPDDTDVVLRLQREYYDKRIGELTVRVQQLDDELRRADFASLAEEHRRLSVDALRASLNARYRELSRTMYSATYKQGSTFASFTRDYPVVLSTCHALLDSIADGYLLDYLVIDEASQVSLLAAGLAMSCCRNLVVVGDLRQLPQIDNDAAEGLEPSGPAYDCRRHNILSSLLKLYPDLPRTLLREHYRCDPAIIGFCNKAFYDGELIPYTVAGAEQPMVVAPTAAGNHMRLHRSGGRSNQREVDVIINEVIPTYCPDVAGTDIGITTPYRRQVDRVADSLIDQIEADTVHKFQGRQRAVVILTTVLDETWRGRTGLKFADDPHLINVAVSRGPAVHPRDQQRHAADEPPHPGPGRLHPLSEPRREGGGERRGLGFRPALPRLLPASAAAGRKVEERDGVQVRGHRLDRLARHPRRGAVRPSCRRLPGPAAQSALRCRRAHSEAGGVRAPPGIGGFRRLQPGEQPPGTRHRGRRLRLPRGQPGSARAGCHQERDPPGAWAAAAAVADHGQWRGGADPEGAGRRRGQRDRRIQGMTCTCAPKFPSTGINRLLGRPRRKSCAPTTTTPQ
jgi:hypothetical protein